MRVSKYDYAYPMLILLTIIACSQSGCRSAMPQNTRAEFPMIAAPEGTPRELCKTFLPEYRIEPPDILVVEAINASPRADYRFRIGDVLTVEVADAFKDAPIQGAYPILIGGFIDLKSPYGTCPVAGLTLEEAKKVITIKLQEQLKDPKVSVGLATAGAIQQVKGEHLVKGDGTIRLGTYGSVIVAGMTLDEAERMVEGHLSQFLDNPDVAIDVFAYNSKVYYVILQGGGMGDHLLKFPHTGNETVLDGLAQVGGLSEVSSKRIWIARPGQSIDGGDQILPVEYDAIARRGDVGTNYQILPGDRLYVEEDPWIAMDAKMGKVFGPFERVMGFSLLGVSTVSRFSGKVLAGGGTRGQFGGGGVF